MFFTATNEPKLALKLFDKIDSSKLNLYGRIYYHASLAIELSEVIPAKLSDSLYHIREAVRLAETSDNLLLLFYSLVLHADIAGELERWQEANGVIRKLYNFLPDFLDTNKSQFSEVVGNNFIFQSLKQRLPLKRALESINKTQDALETVEEIVKCLNLVDPDSSSYKILENIYEKQTIMKKPLRLIKKILNFLR